MTTKLLWAVALLCPCVAVAQPTRHILLPVQSPCISSPFGPRIIPNHPQAGTYHYGVDLPAPEGAEVRAVAAGRIIRSQHRGPGGLEVLVQHAGYIGVYSHLGSIASISEGAPVAAGAKLGEVGRTGVMFGMHLYFEMITSQPIDPAPYLGVPLCQGARTAQRSPLEVLRNGGLMPPSRHYVVLNSDTVIDRQGLVNEAMHHQMK